MGEKVDAKKDYLERLKSLVGQYVPPQREKLQSVFQTGDASLTSSARRSRSKSSAAIRRHCSDVAKSFTKQNPRWFVPMLASPLRVFPP